MPTRTTLTASGALFAAALLATATPARAQVLRGYVHAEDTGAPIVGAQIIILNDDDQPRVRGVTDTSGGFVINVQRAGDYRLQVTHIGYADFLSDDVYVPRREAVELRVRLGTEAIPLEPLVVIARMSAEDAHLSDFNRRRLNPGRVGGHFLTRDDVAGRPNATPTQLLLSVPGVTLDRVNNSGAFAMDRSIIRFPGGMSGGCRASVYVDGSPVSQSESSTIDDMLDHSLIGGVEVYPRATEAPVQFQRNMGCGVVLYWTRRPQGGKSVPGPVRWVAGVGVVLGLFAAVFSAVIG